MIRRLLSQKFGVFFIIGLVFQSCDFNFYQTETTTFDSEIRVTFDRREKSHLAWSPDGTKMAYVVQQQEDFLKSYNYLSGDILSIGQYFSFPSDFDLSHDKAKVVFSDSDRLLTMNLRDGTTNTLLSNFDSNISNPKWSYDDQWITFNAFSNIWIVRSSGSGARELTNTDGSDFLPIWTPNGKKISFLKRVNYTNQINHQIFVLDIETEQLKQLTNDSTTQNIFHSWWPDGSKIVYQSERFGSEIPYSSEIRIMNADGSNKQTLIDDVNRLKDPIISPDGSKIACRYIGGLRIYSKEGQFLDSVSGISRARWYDDESLLFLESKTNSFIEVLSLNDSSTIQLTPQRDFVQAIHPTWFPDSQKLAYIERSTSIRSITATGDDEEILLPHFAYNIAISRDGSWLIFEQSSGRLFLMSLHSGEITDLRQYISSGLFQPSPNPWSNGGVGVSQLGLTIAKSDSNLTIERSLIEGSFSNPDWSPVSPEFGSHIAAESNGNIMIVKPDGSFKEISVFNSRWPTWAPDGERLAYIRWDGEIYIKPVFVELTK